jgi:predicted ATPase
MPMFEMLQAQAYAKAVRNESALEMIEQAISACESSGERWALAEVLRIKASLLLRAGDGRWPEIEAVLHDSLEVAQRQGALC